VRRPSIASLLLAILPFVGMCFTVPLWDRVHPTVLEVPFNMFWMMAWIVLTSAILSVIYCLERRR
jgi:4-amino-4-deoxy-L-arabinose transferase-like glycosyltransferase